MKNRHVTIMIIPERSSKVRKWILSDRFIQRALISGSVLVVMMIVATVISVRYVYKSDEFRTAQLKIQYLEGKLHSLQNKLATSEATLTRVQNFEEKLRVIARVDQVSENAIGPLSEQEERIFLSGGDAGEVDFSKPENSWLDPKLELGLNSMGVAAENIQRKALLQEQSLQHLYELIRDQRSLLSSTPSIWPARGWVTSHFGYRVSPFTGLRQPHTGLDIAAPMGTKIAAPADGVVSNVETESGYGKLLTIRHGYGVVTRYGHSSQILVKVGQKVKRGQVVALVGSTGRSTAPHLHYEVLVNGVHVNPMRYIID